MLYGCEEMILGDSWYFEFEVRPTENDAAVVITEASYILADSETKEIKARGECEINGSNVKALITPSAAGKYTLTVSVAIPPETIQNRSMIVVRG